MLECPHCHRRAMGLWSKLNLRPRKPRPCESCGKPVSTSRVAAVIVFGAMAVGMWASGRVPSLVGALAVLVLFFVVSLLFQAYVVPLERRDS